MIALVAMTDEDFPRFLDQACAEYTRDLVQGGMWKKATAESQSEQVFRELLPQGRKTEGHCFDRIVEESTSTSVGVLWYAIRNDDRGRYAALYFLQIEPDHRRRGFAIAALDRLEDVAREAKAELLRLHVFGHNHGARRLYEKVGFETKHVVMEKNL